MRHAASAASCSCSLHARNWTAARKRRPRYWVKAALSSVKLSCFRKAPSQLSPGASGPLPVAAELPPAQTEASSSSSSNSRPSPPPGLNAQPLQASVIGARHAACAADRHRLAVPEVAPSICSGGAMPQWPIWSNWVAELANAASRSPSPVPCKPCIRVDPTGRLGQAC